MQGSEARALGTKITHSSEHLTGLACHHKEVNPARVLLWEGRASGGSEVTEGTRPSSCLTSRPPGGSSSHTQMSHVATSATSLSTRTGTDTRGARRGVSLWPPLTPSQEAVLVPPAAWTRESPTCPE